MVLLFSAEQTAQDGLLELKLPAVAVNNATRRFVSQAAELKVITKLCKDEESCLFRWHLYRCINTSDTCFMEILITAAMFALASLHFEFSTKCWTLKERYTLLWFSQWLSGNLRERQSFLGQHILSGLICLSVGYSGAADVTVRGKRKRLTQCRLHRRSVKFSFIAIPVLQSAFLPFFVLDHIYCFFISRVIPLMLAMSHPILSLSAAGATEPGD